MATRARYDAVVVGSGPNGLSAAVLLARSGKSVVVFEAEPTVGGGSRSQELTRPGFVHDVCSAIHPLAAASPFFNSLPLAEHGLEFVHPDAPLAHPFDDGSAAMLERSVDATADLLGVDRPGYRKLMSPVARDARSLITELLGSIEPARLGGPLMLRLPRHPIPLARFGLLAIRSAAAVANTRFEDERARGLFAGMAAHGLMPLDRRPSAAFGLVLGFLGHAVGWPAAKGGSQKIADALASYLRELGGEVVTERRITSIDELPAARTTLLDVGPESLAAIARDRLPRRYKNRLLRVRRGPGLFKVDWALDEPVPWKATECQRAGTIHIGGTIGEIAADLEDVWKGRHPARPFIIAAQPSLFDPTRAPDGKHTFWGYCHVPARSDVDMTKRMEAQIERFAPGFRDVIIDLAVQSPAELERHNANLVGGDITGGIQDLRQLVTRPVARLVPYSTPAKGVYICSSSTPPGGGVHGMCGYFAARAALRAEF